MIAFIVGIILLSILSLSVTMPLFFFLTRERFMSNRVDTINLAQSIKFICLERTIPRGEVLLSGSKSDGLFSVLRGSEFLGDNMIFSLPRLFRTLDHDSVIFWKRQLKDISSERPRNRLIFRANSFLFGQDENSFRVGIYYFIHLTPTERTERFILTDLLPSPDEKLLKNEHQR